MDETDPKEAFRRLQENMKKLSVELQQRIFRMCITDDPENHDKDPLRVYYAFVHFNDPSIYYEYYYKCISEINKQKLNMLGFDIKPLNKKTIPYAFPTDYLRDIFNKTTFSKKHKTIYSKYKFIHDFHGVVNYDPKEGICIKQEYYLLRYYYERSIHTEEDILKYGEENGIKHKSKDFIWQNISCCERRLVVDMHPLYCCKNYLAPKYCRYLGYCLT